METTCLCVRSIHVHRHVFQASDHTISRRLQVGETRLAHRAGTAECHRCGVQLRTARASQVRGAHLVGRSASGREEPTPACQSIPGQATTLEKGVLASVLPSDLPQLDVSPEVARTCSNIWLSPPTDQFPRIFRRATLNTTRRPLLAVSTRRRKRHPPAQPGRSQDLQIQSSSDELSSADCVRIQLCEQGNTRENCCASTQEESWTREILSKEHDAKQVPRPTEELKYVVDADYARCRRTNKSTNGNTPHLTVALGETPNCATTPMLHFPASLHQPPRLIKLKKRTFAVQHH